MHTHVSNHTLREDTCKITLREVTCVFITDGIVNDVLKVFLVKYGKIWDGRGAQKILGMPPFEAAAAIVQDYELPCTTEEFISDINPLFSDR